MDKGYAGLAVEALKSMYDHNSKFFATLGSTEMGPEQITAEQVANDLRTIYNELVKRDS